MRPPAAPPARAGAGCPGPPPWPLSPRPGGAGRSASASAAGPSGRAGASIVTAAAPSCRRPPNPSDSTRSRRLEPASAVSSAASWDGLSFTNARAPSGGAVRVDLVEPGVAGAAAPLTADAPPPPPTASSTRAASTTTQHHQARRRVRAEVRVAARAETVWAVLTDFERLPSIVPNLEACERLGEAPSPSALPRLRQRASAQCRFWRLEAEAVLELEARGPEGPARVRELAFSLVEGDFRELAGRWVVAPLPSPTPGGPSLACLLRYELEVVPRWPVPAAVVAAVVSAGLPSNVAAIAAAAEAAEAAAAAPRGLAAAALAADPPLPVAGPWQEADEEDGEGGDGGGDDDPPAPPVLLPAKGPPRLQAAPWPTVRLQAAALGRMVGLGSPSASPSSPAARLGASDYLGVSSVPLPTVVREAAPPPASAAQPPPPPPRPAPDGGAITVEAGALASADLAAAEERRAAAARVASLYPAFTPSSPASSPASSWRPPAVHVRRLDTAAGGLHRRAVAEVWVGAPPSDVWAVLTDYERLPDIVPGLVASDVLSVSSEGEGGGGGGGDTTASPSSASSSSSSSSPTVTRLRQVGYKRMMYVELHAEAVLDVVARVREGGGSGSGGDSSDSSSASSPPSLTRELQFRAVAGDFDLLRGKFMVEPAGGSSEDDSDGGSPSPEDGSGLPAAATLLRYAVEVKAARASPVLGLLEPWLEAVVVEDVPAALGAVGRAAEARAAERALAAVAAGGGRGGESPASSDGEEDEADEDEDESLDAAAAAAAAARVAERWRRPRVAEMAEDFAVLAAELQRCFGGGGGGGPAGTPAARTATPTMPGRAALRAAGRSDLEKAIAAHGGPASVAARLGWKPAQAKNRRKPAGYWDDAANVEAELAAFIAENGLPPGTMPSRTELVRAARWDVARAAERWGGLYALAQAIGYEMPTRASSSEWASHVSAVAAATGLSGTNGLFERAAATYRPSRAGSPAASAVSEAGEAPAKARRAARRAAAEAGLAALDSADDAAALAPLLEAGEKEVQPSSSSSKAAPAKPRGLRDEIDAW